MIKRAVAAVFVCCLGSASLAAAQPLPPGPPPAATAAATPLASAITAAVSLCLPRTFTLAGFELRAGAAGWTEFRTAPGNGRSWRVSDRAIDAGHRVSVAATSGDLAGAPRTTPSFNCKIVLQPGAPSDFTAALAGAFGPDDVDGGFFITERGAMRPMTIEEGMVAFPDSLGPLHAGQRMVFMQIEQRGGAEVVSIDSFEPAAQ